MSKFNPRKIVLITLSILAIVSATATVQKYVALRQIKKEKVSAKKFEEDFNTYALYPIELNEKTTLVSVKATGFNLHYQLEINDWYDDAALEEYKNIGFGLSIGQQLCHSEMLKKPIVLTFTIRFMVDDKKVFHEETLTQYCHFEPDLF